MQVYAGDVIRSRDGSSVRSKSPDRQDPSVGSVILARPKRLGGVVRTDDEPDNGQFVLEWPESVALASMQIAMMQADLAVTRDEDEIAGETGGS